MTPSVILLLGALVCALGVLIFVVLAIKFRDEDWAFLLLMAALAGAGAAGGAFNEAVKKAENEQRIPVDVQPGQ